MWVSLHFLKGCTIGRHRCARATWRGVCSLLALLVFAQLGAQVHAYSHLDDLAPSHAKHVHSNPCSECASFSALLTGHGGTASPGIAPPALPPSYEAHSTTAAPESRLILGFHSRGPPTVA
jgi:hypothetical protein